ncbi:glycosyltransferase family 1 protein [Lentithecium fluviatile CBS 122367]|uniref:Glycosyltransferase family 1 protein n=1 Tax=Lentithecium fluviatile CBS 122367 TaxID=1168545 RepID=A0A6G1ID08_9PLEO|nr:glycosyltransferase family 1 protein [Lentithecium fluviatile CBS 122367]
MFTPPASMLPPRKILIVTTVGGSTNSAPIFEVCKLLHERGHTIEYATLAHRETYAALYPFVSAIHVVGRAITPVEEDALFLRFCEWSWKGKGLRDMIWGKKFFESFWPETYTNLKRLIESTKPDLVFGDYLVDACGDMQREYKVPPAVMYPQWPYFTCPVSYISGTPGLRMDFLTNENASMWARFNQEIYVLKHILPFVDLFRWTKRMRAEFGLKMLPVLRKPDHLVLVNSLIGVETPKDVPLLATPVGPILLDTYA